MKSLLKNKLSSVYKLNEKDLELFIEKWNPVSFKKNAFITKKGSEEQYLYFIIKGIAIGYIENKKFRKISLGFAYDNDFTFAIDSFLSGEKTELNLIAGSDITGFRISKKDIEAFYKQNHQIERLGRKLMEMLLLLMSKQQIYYLTMSAEERYLRFIKQSRHLLQMVAQKHIASYLGMSAETFSRLQKKNS